MGSFAQNFNYLNKITPPGREANDRFGLAVGLSGNYAIIGAADSDTDSAGANYSSSAGNAFLWERNPSNGAWGFVKKLSPSGTNSRASNDYMGISVGISGDYCIVGSRDHDYDSTGANFLNAAGAAFIWERNNAGAWTQVKKLTVPDRGNSNDQFGVSVAIDGNYAIVGAHFQDTDSVGGDVKSGAGAAYIYERVNGTWGFTKKITPPTTNNGRVATDHFGTAVAIKGNYAVVTAIDQDWDSAGGNSITSAGAVYVFERVNGEWGYTKKLTPPNTNNARVADDVFGTSVSIDGTTIVVGAPEQDWDSVGGNSLARAGAAYVFERNNGEWGYIKKLTPPNTNNARAIVDRFGYSVSISGDYLLIGATYQNWDSTGGAYQQYAGAAYQFKKNNGEWGYIKKLTPHNASNARTTNDRFGSAVAVSGTYALVGGRNGWDSVGGDQKSDAGAAYFFIKNSCDLEYNNGWGVGTSPTDTTGVCICTVTAGTATIPSNAALKILNVDSGATASLSGDLSLSTTYTNNGTVSGVGKVILNGSLAQNIYGTGTTRNLELNNSAGATVQDSLGINGVLTLTAGTLTTNNKLKLEATSATTYGQIAGTGAGSLSGNLTAEMQINGGGAGWRPISSPVSGATLAQLSDDVNLNFGAPENSFATVYYFNEETSPYWTIPSDTSAAFGDSAFSVYMGGSSSWSNVLPLTIDIQGNYRGTSDYTYTNLTRTGSLADTTGWHYVSNPWPSGFLWDDANITINSGGIQGNQVWVYNQSAGAYQVFDGTDNGVIPPFTPVLFEVTTNNTSITLKNSARTTDSLLNYFDKTSLPNFVQVQVTDKNGKTDKVKFYTDDNATNGYDVMDGNKRINLVAPNLYFVLEGKKANKEAWNTLPQANEPVQLSFEAQEAGQYTLNFTTENIEPNIVVELVDRISGARHDINKGDYLFAHDLSNVANRFELRFTKKSAVSVEETAENPLYIGCTGNTVTIVAPNTGNYTVEIIDLLGRTVQAPVTFTGNQVQTVTVNGASAGYYLVKVKGDSIFKTTKVFLK